MQLRDAKARVQRGLGERARAAHNIPAAQSRYEEAVSLLRNSGDRLLFAHTMRHLGDIHAEQKHWAEAERCFTEALEICRSHPSPAVDFANAIRPLALLKFETGRTDEARPLLEEAARLYEAAGIQAGVAECRERLSKITG